MSKWRYKFPDKLVEKIKIQQIRIAMQATCFSQHLYFTFHSTKQVNKSCFHGGNQLRFIDQFTFDLSFISTILVFMNLFNCLQMCVNIFFISSKTNSNLPQTSWTILWKWLTSQWNLTIECSKLNRWVILNKSKCYGTSYTQKKQHQQKLTFF